MNINAKANKLILYSLILAFLGFLDATYLTVLHYKNIFPPCNITSGCERVLTSSYSLVGPIPLALLGSLFYLSVIIICILLLTNYKKILLDAYYLFISTGFIVSVVLLMIQEFLIKAFCQYCVLSEIISFGLVALAFLKFRESRRIK